MLALAPSLQTVDLLKALAKTTLAKDAIEVFVPNPDGLSATDLGTDALAETIKNAEGTKTAEPSGVGDALQAGEIDCGVMPAPAVLALADSSTGPGQAMVLVAQLGPTGDDKAAPVTLIACRIATLGDAATRNTLKTALVGLRTELSEGEERNAESKAGLVDVEALRALLITMKGNGTVTNAALEIVDLGTKKKAPQPAEGTSIVLVDNRFIAGRKTSEKKAQGKKGNKGQKGKKGKGKKGKKGKGKKGKGNKSASNEGQADGE
jgi:hypothetical protein